MIPENIPVLITDCCAEREVDRECTREVGELFEAFTFVTFLRIFFGLAVVMAGNGKSRDFEGLSRSDWWINKHNDKLRGYVHVKQNE